MGMKVKSLSRVGLFATPPGSSAHLPALQLDGHRAAAREPHSVRMHSVGPTDLRAHGNLSPKRWLERQRPPGSGARHCLLGPIWWREVL